MAVYEFEFQSYGERFEVTMGISEHDRMKDQPPACPQCGKRETQQLVSSFNCKASTDGLASHSRRPGLVLLTCAIPDPHHRAAVRSRWALCRAGPWKKRNTDRGICRILGWAAARVADEDAECWPRRRLPDWSWLVDQLEEGDVRGVATP